MPRTPKTPQYLHHKARNTAKVIIDGQVIYLGPYNSKESLDRYDELIRAWRARQDVDRFRLTVAELAVLYVERHALTHYRKGGQSTSELKCIQLALRHLVKVHGKTRVLDFGPVALKQVRQAMVDAGYQRKSINRHIGRIRRAFKWGVAEQLFPVATLTALETVDGLLAGRCDAPEGEPVRAISQAAIDAVEPYVSRPVWGAIRVQLLTGMRPGEVLAMRGCDLNMSGEIWEYTVTGHKTVHHGKTRTVFIGPKAQIVIREFLTTDLQAYLFRPAEGRGEYLSQFDDPEQDTQAGERYSGISYLVAIRRACERAFGMPDELRKIPPANQSKKLKTPDARKAFLSKRKRLLRAAAEWRRAHVWSPNQLRHSAATIIRREAGLEVARCVLGHSSAVTSEIYAEADHHRARQIMAQVG